MQTQSFLSYTNPSASPTRLRTAAKNPQHGSQLSSSVVPQLTPNKGEDRHVEPEYSPHHSPF
jgi:hypothetical protein